MTDLDDFTAAYIETALWASTDDEGNPLDQSGLDRGAHELAPETRAKMIADCLDFQHFHGAAMSAAIETGEVVCGPDFDEYGRAGHDFWLTRCGHGAGFWDGDWPEPYATKLTDAAHAFGNVDLYIGDNGLIYA